MAAFSNTSFSTNAFSETAFSFGAGLTVEIDTHDGEPDRRKKYKESQEKRRKDIETAFELAFSEDSGSAKEMAVQYLPNARQITPQSVKSDDFDIEKFTLKQSNLDWVEKVLKRKQERDEEDMIIAYLITRH